MFTQNFGSVWGPDNRVNVEFPYLDTFTPLSYPLVIQCSKVPVLIQVLRYCFMILNKPWIICYMSSLALGSNAKRLSTVGQFCNLWASFCPALLRHQHASIYLQRIGKATVDQGPADHPMFFSAFYRIHHAVCVLLAHLSHCLLTVFVSQHVHAHCQSSRHQVTS